MSICEKEKFSNQSNNNYNDIKAGMFHCTWIKLIQHANDKMKGVLIKENFESNNQFHLDLRAEYNGDKHRFQHFYWYIWLKLTQSQQGSPPAFAEMAWKMGLTDGHPSSAPPGMIDGPYLAPSSPPLTPQPR